MVLCIFPAIFDCRSTRREKPENYIQPSLSFALRILQNKTGARYLRVYAREDADRPWSLEKGMSQLRLFIFVFECIYKYTGNFAMTISVNIGDEFLIFLLRFPSFSVLNCQFKKLPAHTEGEKWKREIRGFICRTLGHFRKAIQT